MLGVQDFKAAFNSLRKAKAYVITIVLTLGITLGALVAMFNLNYQLLARPLPYADQDRLFIANPRLLRDGVITTSGALPYPALVEAYRAKDGYVEQKALVKVDSNIIASLPDTPLVRISYVTPEYLSLLQVPMTIGRSFSPEEGIDTNTPVVVLSFNTWQKIFKEDADIVGKKIQIGTATFSVIGVIAKEFVEPQFDGVGQSTEVWLPWDYAVRDEGTRQHWGRFVSKQHIVGKLKAGQSPDIIAQALSITLTTRFKDWLTQVNYSGADIRLDFSLERYQDAILGDVKTRLFLLFAGATALLLIAVVNITNLMLARVSNQQRNMAIQAAVGAQKSHLFSGLLAEILWLILFVMLLALLVSYWGVGLLKSFAKDVLPRVAELHLSWQSLVFTLVLGLVLALVFAFLVSRQINYRALNQLLQTSGKGTGVQLSKKVRLFLVFSQVMFTAIVLTASMQILFKSLQHIRQPLGFAEKDIYRIALTSGAQLQWPITPERTNTLIAIRNHLLTSPKVVSASLASSAPINNYGLTDFLSLTPDYQQLIQNSSTFIDKDFLSLFEFEFLEGRNFTEADYTERTPVIIINETLARKLHKDGKVLNKRFYWQNAGQNRELNEVIGIVRDLNFPGVPEQARMYISAVAAFDETELIVKLKPQQTISKQEINELIAGIDSQYKVASIESVAEQHDGLNEQDVLGACLTGALTLLALSLAAIGIYGVLSYSAQLRRSELGIRMAVGASPQSIALQILRDNLTPVVIGLLVAAASLVAIWLWLQHANYNLQTTSLGCMLPPVMILLLTVATSLLSVWKIIGSPASDVLRGN
ncbi:hypothetical protein GCM10011613_20200 [Cellvibrio zantedeschiae]|uniref:ABC transporter permease n=1 Tax=Cellvibrio zantedeschiae TaxID=1237077 RepID=A0ABQ3B5S2_9GAMM|nr:ABC transporter permease [Cellvibrio zantedeschiae]GGY74698.1 hypothetical protein GCM10011613_20200 [Cellvibrio zantedeschiae]